MLKFYRPTISDEKMSTQNRKTPLKAVKREVRVKRSDVRQCRLCLRVVPRELVRCTRSGIDFRRKVFDAVSVKITAFDRTTAVCINCLRLVDMIYSFRKACRKTDLIQTNTSLMLHEGNWTGEENQEALENCQELVRRNRSEIDQLFEYSGLTSGQPHEEIVKTTEDVVLESIEEPNMQADEITDSEPEMSLECATQFDTVVEKKKRDYVPGHKYICEICGQLVDKNESEYHHNKHLNFKPYICPEEGCETTFYSERSKDRHVKTVHLDQGERFECPICQRMIKGKVHLEQHITVHGENNKRKVPCPICGKKFYSSYLKDHQSVHSGAMNYSCEKCGRRYNAKTNCTTHQKKCRAKPMKVESDEDIIYN
ncbi:zinc finger protein 69 homolog [Topomyia yanbarensis]|uniref:zinc finger protein 69 homolog n=1 Tax=Topomyia yanbarensis TaxID=2498891 RepID=UPI00273BE75D|nr:zinc finger protein 69 homolog [Topomyia yanbarensis]